MPKVRLAASVFVTLFLVGLCIFLMPSAFSLAVTGPRGEIGAGALPQFVVIVVPLLVIAIAISDVRAYRRGGLAQPVIREGEADVTEADPRRVLGLGALILALLSLYALAWRYVGFPVASIAFMATMALVLLPPDSRNLRGIATAVATTLLFCLGTWAFFVHVLAVPLR